MEWGDWFDGRPPKPGGAKGNPPVTAEAVLAAALMLAKTVPPPEPVVIVTPTRTALVNALGVCGEPGQELEAYNVLMGRDAPFTLHGIPIHVVPWAPGPRLIPAETFEAIAGLIRKAFPGARL